MHMRPPTHVATTKGESTKPVSATNVEGENSKAAKSSKKAVEAEIPPAEQQELSQKERDAIEALAKATISLAPKVKAKGVVIQEGVSKAKKVDQDAAKRKGKEILIETESQLKKKKTQLQLDEELAKKLQEEELAQAEVEKAAAKLKKQRAQTKTKRKPSITKVKQDERKKMVTFLKSALNVNVKMVSFVSFKNLEDLYKKEMKTLQGDTEKRDELERKLKAQHNVQKPFPEE